MNLYGYCMHCQALILFEDLEQHGEQTHPGKVLCLNLYVAEPEELAPAAVAAHELPDGGSAGADPDGGADAS